MSDLMEYVENVLKTQKEIETLRAKNARYREALEFIAEGDIAPSSIKYRYIDEAYQQIASKALKGGE